MLRLFANVKFLWGLIQVNILLPAATEILKFRNRSLTVNPRRHPSVTPPPSASSTTSSSPMPPISSSSSSSRSNATTRRASCDLFYPSASTSLHPLTPGTTLTYHLVTPQLALLALLPTSVFEGRRGLIEFNVVFFREGVQEICEIETEARSGG